MGSSIDGGPDVERYKVKADGDARTRESRRSNPSTFETPTCDCPFSKFSRWAINDGILRQVQPFASRLENRQAEKRRAKMSNSGPDAEGVPYFENSACTQPGTWHAMSKCFYSTKQRDWRPEEDIRQIAKKKAETSIFVARTLGIYLKGKDQGVPRRNPCASRQNVEDIKRGIQDGETV